MSACYDIPTVIVEIMGGVVNKVSKDKGVILIIQNHDYAGANEDKPYEEIVYDTDEDGL